MSINPDATYTIYDYAYYLPLSWPADKQFTNNDWSIVNPNNSDEMMTPHLGYWILIQNFNANAITNQAPNIIGARSIINKNIYNSNTVIIPSFSKSTTGVMFQNYDSSSDNVQLTSTSIYPVSFGYANPSENPFPLQDYFSQSTGGYAYPYNISGGPLYYELSAAVTDDMSSNSATIYLYDNIYSDSLTKYYFKAIYDENGKFIKPINNELTTNYFTTNPSEATLFTISSLTTAPVNGDKLSKDGNYPNTSYYTYFSNGNTSSKEYENYDFLSINITTHYIQFLDGNQIVDEKARPDEIHSFYLSTNPNPPGPPPSTPDAPEPEPEPEPEPVPESEPEPEPESEPQPEQSIFYIDPFLNNGLSNINSVEGIQCYASFTENNVQFPNKKITTNFTKLIYTNDDDTSTVEINNNIEDWTLPFFNFINSYGWIGSGNYRMVKSDIYNVDTFSILPFYNPYYPNIPPNYVKIPSINQDDRLIQKSLDPSTPMPILLTTNIESEPWNLPLNNVYSNYITNIDNTIVQWYPFIPTCKFLTPPNDSGKNYYIIGSNSLFVTGNSKNIYVPPVTLPNQDPIPEQNFTYDIPGLNTTSSSIYIIDSENINETNILTTSTSSPWYSAFNYQTTSLDSSTEVYVQNINGNVFNSQTITAGYLSPDNSYLYVVSIVLKKTIKGTIDLYNKINDVNITDINTSIAYCNINELPNSWVKQDLDLTNTNINYVQNIKYIDELNTWYISCLTNTNECNLMKTNDLLNIETWTNAYDSNNLFPIQPKNGFLLYYT